MKIDKLSIAIGVLSILFLAGGIFFLFTRIFQGDDVKENKEDGSYTNEIIPDTADTPGNETIEKDGISDIAIPDLDRPIIAPSGIPEDRVALAREKIQELSSALKENSRLFSHWLDLGAYRKMIEDFAGAFEAWQYARVLQPNDARPYNNIGNLYVYYLHNNEEGEKYLLRAIEKSPDGLQYYAAAFEFYYYVLKDEKRGKEILEEGIARNPNTASPLRELLYSLEDRI